MSPKLLHTLFLTVSLLALSSWSKRCYHIVNVQTGQYLQSTDNVDPTTNYYRYAWLSYDNREKSLWFVENYTEIADTFYMVNRDSGEFLTVHPDNDLAYVMHRNISQWMPRNSFLFRFWDEGKPAEIVSSLRNYSLYAASLGVQGGYVGSNSRCGLDSCKWRFEGYEC